jgi:hypothetical protein
MSWIIRTVQDSKALTTQWLETSYHGWQVLITKVSHKEHNCWVFYDTMQFWCVIVVHNVSVLVTETASIIVPVTTVFNFRNALKITNDKTNICNSQLFPRAISPTIKSSIHHYFMPGCAAGGQFCEVHTINILIRCYNATLWSHHISLHLIVSYCIVLHHATRWSDAATSSNF